MEMLSYFNPPGYSSLGVVNSARWRDAEVPSTNGHGTARGVARLYAGLLEDGRLLSADLLREATSPQSSGYCPILHEDVTFGLGFQPDGAPPSLRAQPRELRSFRDRWRRRFRRSRHGRSVRLRHERRHPALAEHAQSRVDRRALRRALSAAHPGAQERCARRSRVRDHVFGAAHALTFCVRRSACSARKGGP